MELDKLIENVDFSLNVNVFPTITVPPVALRVIVGVALFIEHVTVLSFVVPSDHIFPSLNSLILVSRLLSPNY